MAVMKDQNGVVISELDDEHVGNFLIAGLVALVEPSPVRGAVCLAPTARFHLLAELKKILIEMDQIAESAASPVVERPIYLRLNQIFGMFEAEIRSGNERVYNA